MKKEDFIKRRGKEAYEKRLQQERERMQKWKREHPEDAREKKRLWRQNNPDKVKAQNQKWSREKNCGGKYYEHRFKYDSEGLRRDRNLIRMKHRDFYRTYKQIIAQDSQIHHQWVPGTAEYTGVALVEKDQHMHGFVDVTQILEGEITLLTEAEIRTGKG